MYMNDITWFRQVKINPCDCYVIPLMSNSVRNPLANICTLIKNLTLDIEGLLRLTGTLCCRSTYNQLTLYQTTAFWTWPTWKQLQTTKSMYLKWWFLFWWTRKQSWKRRECWLIVFSPLFSEAFFRVFVTRQFVVKGHHCKPVDISLHIFHTMYLGINTFWQIIGINNSLNFRTVRK